METSSIVIQRYDPAYVGNLLKNFKATSGVGFGAEDCSIAGDNSIEFQLSVSSLGPCKLSVEELVAEPLWVNGNRPLYSKEVQLSINGYVFANEPVSSIAREYVWSVPTSNLIIGDNTIKVYLPPTYVNVNGRQGVTGRVRFKRIIVTL